MNNAPRKIISIFLVALMLSSMLPTTVFAATAPKVTAASVEKEMIAGQTVDVDITLSDNPGITGGTVKIEFEKAKLKLTSVKNTDQTITSTYYGYSVMPITSGSYTLGWDGDLMSADLTGNGVIATLTFEVLDTATVGDSAITVSNVDFVNAAADSVAGTGVNGKVTLYSKLTGDLPIDITVPVKGAAPQSAIAAATQYTGTIAWEGSPSTFAADTAYTAKVELTANTGYQFANDVTPTVTDATISDKSVSPDGSKLEFKAAFPTTDAQSTPVCAAPTGVTAAFGSALSTITLTNPTGNTDGRWYWMDNTQKVGNVKDNPHTYKAKFVPTDTANYKTVENIDVPVTATPVALGAGSPIMIPIEVYYTGSALEPTPKIMTELYGDELVLGLDYEITKYEGNTNVGTGKIFIAPLANGNYSFTAGSYTFDIKAGTSSISITGDPGKTYDGNAVDNPTVSKSGSTGAVTYTYYTDEGCTTETTTANSGAASNGAAPKNAGDYWVTATVAASGSYGSATSVAKKFTISQKALTDSMIILGTQATYDGSAHGPVYSVKDGTTVLNKGTDYIETSGFNPLTNVGNMTLGISGAGNYTGEAIATWSLAAKDVTITPASGLSKTYGTADPTLPYTTSIDGDATLKPLFDAAKSGALSYTGTDVGAYIIGLGTLEAGNNFNLKLDTSAVFFTINQATPVITATTPRQLVNNGVEIDISDWASFTNTDSGAELTYALDSAPAGITLVGNKLKAASSVAAGATFDIKVNAYGTHNFTAPATFTITVEVVNKTDAGVRITTPPTSKTYGDASFTLSATKSAPDGGTWSWSSSDDTILEIVSGADTATPTIKVKKADAAGAALTVTYTSSTHYGSDSATITVAQKEVTVAAGDYKVSKEYDSTTGIGTASGALSVSGILTGDAVTVVTAPVAYTDADVGGQSTMDVNITLVGTDKDNYKIEGGATTVSVPCEITAKDVTLTGGINATGRSYVRDNKTVGLTKGTLTFTGLVSGETLDVSIPATGTISDAKVGTYNVTYSGVTLADGTGKASNYNLVGSLPAVTVNITKATAPALADIPVSQKYNVTTEQSKNIGNSGMPADAGALTYTKGAGSKTGSVTIDSWDVDATGKVTYTLSGGAAGDTVALPVIIGSDNYADATVKVVITLTAKDDQAALTLTGGTTVVYGQTLQLGTSGGSGTGAVTYAVTNVDGQATVDASGKLTPVKVGKVRVSATKAGDASYNSITSAEVEITITRATSTGAPKYTAITTSGKTLADAGLTTAGSTLNPNAGTLVWVDNAGNVLPGTTTVEANTTYKWLFTPADANYTTLTGSIELYHKSTSSGGGSYYAPEAPDMPMVYWGCTGDAVKTLQEKLNAKGFDSGNVDGIFGAKTYAAVTAFQKANSLGVDGIVGKLTWAKLYDATPVSVTPVTTQPMLRTGSRGDAVRKLQELLNAKGYTCGNVDGIFGIKTYAAVLEFQKANSLGVDGIVGPLTWAKLG